MCRAELVVSFSDAAVPVPCSLPHGHMGRHQFPAIFFENWYADGVEVLVELRTPPGPPKPAA